MESITRPYTSKAHPMTPDVGRAIRLCRDYLLNIQYDEGYWWGELESNATMEAEFIMLNYFLGTAEEAKVRKK